MHAPRLVIGRVLLEDANGRAHLTVLYGLPPSSRAPVLYCTDGLYTQQRQTDDGQWVYRYTGPRSAEQGESDGLSDYQPVQ